MRASKLDVSFAPDNDGRSQPKNALATGDAWVTVHTIHSAAPQQSTTLKGDQLFATLTDGHKLSTLRGDGHTYLLEESPGGISQTSSADTLMVKFAPMGSPAAGGIGAVAGAMKKPVRSNNQQTLALPGRQGGSQIESAVQQGHAVLAQLQPSTVPGGPPAKTTAMADTITYEGASGRINLTGGAPRIVQVGGRPDGQQDDTSKSGGMVNAATDGQAMSDLTADAIQFNRFTGDASATGGVKATYEGSTSQNTARTGVSSDAAMHVIADHASLDHTKDETTFFGVPHTDARLWQGSSSITAPVIILARTRQLLIAQGPDKSVKATFAEGVKGTGKGIVPAGSSPASPSRGPAVGGGVMRITSSALTYSGGERQAAFSGGVTGSDAAGTLRAASLVVYLAPEGAALDKASVAGNVASPSGPGKTKGVAGTTMSGPGGHIDHIVATGRVDFQQGDRKATGDKLVYTAEDQHFVLTGTADAPPRVTDPVHGTVTGGSLIFNNRDDSVVVSRGQAATMTDTRATK